MFNICLIFIQIRFINLVENLEENISLESVEKVRANFLASIGNRQLSCYSLLTNRMIKNNILSLIEISNTSSSSVNIRYHIQKNLSKEVINRGAKLFIYLNTCPKKSQELLESFEDVILINTRELVEKTNSEIILFTLNAMKLSSNDGRFIASKILEKVSSLLNLSDFQPQKGYKISTYNNSIGMRASLFFLLI